MNLNDWLMVLAVLLSPLIAVQVTRYLDNKKEARERQLWIFKTLMATRASSLSPHHVEALNRIDLEFKAQTKKDREVIEAWKVYLDLLGNDQMAADQWNIRRIDLLVELLQKMAIVLDYSFDKTTIKNSAYYPRGFGALEDEQGAIRRGVKELLEGQRHLPMYVTNFPPPDLPVMPQRNDG
ncbi:MAG: hypothetical protein QM761_13945 [Pseudoxanthomonas sp.]